MNGNGKFKSLIIMRIGEIEGIYIVIRDCLV